MSHSQALVCGTVHDPLKPAMLPPKPDRAIDHSTGVPPDDKQAGQGIAEQTDDEDCEDEDGEENALLEEDEGDEEDGENEDDEDDALAEENPPPVQQWVAKSGKPR